VLLDAAHELIVERGDGSFTTQDLVKQAGVALQTFYRYFAGKDELLLAVIADSMAGACARWAESGKAMADPLDRLRFYITSALTGIGRADTPHVPPAGFIVSTRWQLHQAFPIELAAAEQPFVDLLRLAIVAANEAGSTRSPDPDSDAWMIVALVRSVYHHYAHAPPEPDIDARLWTFCARLLGVDQR
jgi:AcrR family transcriptional regulator